MCGRSYPSFVIVYGDHVQTYWEKLDDEPVFSFVIDISRRLTVLVASVRCFHLLVVRSLQAFNDE